MADALSSPSDSSILQIILCIILHDLFFLCSLIISHPLYSSYFIFFAPYFIKLMSFVSPLFTAVFILSLLITTTTAFCPKLPRLELRVLEIVIQELKSNLYNVNEDEEFNFEDFEIYKIVFDSTLSSSIGNECDEEASTTEKILEVSFHGGRRNDVATSDSGMEKILEKSIRGGRRNDFAISDPDVVKLEGKNFMKKLFEELDRYEDCRTAINTEAVSDEVIGELGKAEPVPVEKVVSVSEAVNSSDDYKISPNSCRSSSWRSNSSSTISSHGSMREDKEWRRTLSCKLFEERHNSRGGDEGMDSLWEVYENDNSKNQKEIMINNKNKMMVKNNNTGGTQSSDEDDDDDEDDEQRMSNGHLCCLQALKLSTGKTNLGMRKLNLVKISKALKGFGFM